MLFDRQRTARRCGFARTSHQSAHPSHGRLPRLFIVASCGWPAGHAYLPSAICKKSGLRSGGYSGGGFNVDLLLLFSVTSGADPSVAQVLDTPLSAGLSIRACFSEQDVEKRLGSCHDEYYFESRIEATGRKTHDVPDLLWTTEATRRPAGVSRMADSTLMPPLTEDQIILQRDAECSFNAVLSWDLDSESYRPESPIPNCSEFTQP